MERYVFPLAEAKLSKEWIKNERVSFNPLFECEYLVALFWMKIFVRYRNLKVLWRRGNQFPETRYYEQEYYTCRIHCVIAEYCVPIDRPLCDIRVINEKRGTFRKTTVFDIGRERWFRKLPSLDYFRFSFASRSQIRINNNNKKRASWRH